MALPSLSLALCVPIVVTARFERRLLCPNIRPGPIAAEVGTCGAGPGAARPARALGPPSWRTPCAPPGGSLSIGSLGSPADCRAHGSWLKCKRFCRKLRWPPKPPPARPTKRSRQRRRRRSKPSRIGRRAPSTFRRCGAPGDGDRSLKGQGGQCGVAKPQPRRQDCRDPSGHRGPQSKD